MNTLAFGFSSLRSPGTSVTTCVLGVTTTTLVPPGELVTVRVVFPKINWQEPTQCLHAQIECP